jgi:hypothetical protein
LTSSRARPRCIVSRLAGAALLGAVIVALAGCGPLERQELKDSVEIVHSIAAEGAVLADDVAHGRTTANFARAHAGELSSEAQHQAEKINDATPVRGIRREARAAIAIASDESNALDDLRTSPKDREQARMSRARLQKAAKDSDRLEMGL